MEYFFYGFTILFEIFVLVILAALCAQIAKLGDALKKSIAVEVDE